MKNKIVFSQCSDLVQEKFADEKAFVTFSKICLDTYNNKLANGHSVEDANKIIRGKMLEICGLMEKPSEREIRKALKKTAVREAIFEIIEETVDNALITGWGNDPFFRKYVDFKTGVLGDKNSYYLKDECILTISKIANGHHNLNRQRLAGGTTRQVETAMYGAKVYMELSRFIQGVEDWSALINAIANAYTLQVNTMIHDAFVSASAALPVPTKWNKRGQAIPANKATLKRLISDVKLATGSPVAIVGTEVALSELTGFGEVAWASSEAKTDIYKMGRLGTFEGITIIELPQAFAPNDVETYLEDDTKLMIMPENIGQFIHMYYEGAEEIVETEQRDGDDTKDYEFKALLGVEVATTSRFGTWTIGA